jgi:hypothetical protein
MPALFYRPYEAIDDIGRTRVPPAMCWDPDIDRWVNEGGAVCKRPAICNDSASRKFL